MIIPAIDLIEGKVVRLFQGNYQEKTEYNLDPVDVVHRYADAGATWLHIVDLTGAKDTNKRQTQLISDMVATKRMQFQAGGGIRSREDLISLFDAGVKRVVIGSLAVKQPELVQSWFEEFGNEAIVLALDVNINAHGERMVATHGWQEDSGVSLDETMQNFPDVKHILCTDISRDGTLQGANQQLYADLVKSYPDVEWQASGGIGSLEDIQNLTPTQVQHVILGRSLLEGKFQLEEAIELWSQAC